MLRPTVIVIAEPSTTLVSSGMPAALKFLPMKAVLLSVPLIRESTSGIATMPPDPFSLHAWAFVSIFDLIARSTPIVAVFAATYALAVGETFTVAVGRFTAARRAPPPPVADADVWPLPLGGEAIRRELPSGAKSCPPEPPVSWR